MKTKSFILTLAAALSAGNFITAQEPFAAANPVPDYIRYRAASASGQPDVLETATSRFQKGDHTVDLISVVHLGDADYFKRLKQSLTGYDAVFYEMVGGPYTEEKARISREAASPDDEIAKVQGLQQMAKNLLGLEFQLDSLDYLAPNFVHADMSADEFSDHAGGGKEVSDMVAKAMKIVQSGKVRGLPNGEAETSQLMSKLMGAVLSGNSNQLKRSLGPILAEAESFITEMEDGEGTVLISKRNKVVLEKMNEIVAARGPGPKKDAILFGAGHMPDLENRLREAGYVKSGTEWDTSWVINEGETRNQNAPSIEDLLKQVSGLMEMMKEQ